MAPAAPPDPMQYLDLALAMADAANPIVMRYFRGDLEIEAKSDLSPVTAADRKAETAMRDLIEAAHPDHGIYGEEHGKVRVDAQYVWVLDPIDGTMSFVTGKPLFGTLIGLVRNGVPILGVIDAPAMGERWIGMAGHQTTFNGKPVWARACDKLGHAWLYATSPDMFEGADAKAFNHLRKKCRRTVFGADCYAYGLLANGTVDLVCEAALEPYDFIALAPVIKGAGGFITTWEGDEVTLYSGPRVLAAGDVHIHETALEMLGA